MSAVNNPEQGLDADERIVIVDETTNEVVGSARRADMVRLPWCFRFRHAHRER